jgi:hypothetical protein
VKRKILLFVFLLISVAGSASAGKNTRGFGLGFMVGEPSGLNAKIWTGSRTAFDAGVALSLNQDSGVAAHVDYLWHVHDLSSKDRAMVPFYYGIGVRYRDRDSTESKSDNFGVRIPLGLDYLFARSGFDIFFELVPVLDLAPDQEFNVNLAAGGRYFF